MRIKHVAFAVAIGSVLGASLCFVARTGSGAGGPTVQEPPPGFKLEGDAARGGGIYKQYCQKCHGKKGNGKGMMAQDLDPKPADFTDKARMEKRTDWQIFLGIREGGLAVGLSDQMTGWKDTLTEQEMHDVAIHIRQFAQ